MKKPKTKPNQTNKQTKKNPKKQLTKQTNTRKDASGPLSHGTVECSSSQDLMRKWGAGRDLNYIAAT